MQDTARKNELAVILKKDTLRLYFEIERGLNVEIKVNPEATKDSAAGDVEQLRAISVKLQYPQLVEEPMLRLPPGADADTTDVFDSPETKKAPKGPRNPKKKGTDDLKEK